MVGNHAQPQQHGQKPRPVAEHLDRIKLTAIMVRMQTGLQITPKCESIRPVQGYAPDLGGDGKRRSHSCDIGGNSAASTFRIIRPVSSISVANRDSKGFFVKHIKAACTYYAESQDRSVEMTVLSIDDFLNFRQPEKSHLYHHLK